MFGSFIEIYLRLKSEYKLRSSLFWNVTQCRLLVADVLGKPVGPILKGQVVYS
jgi:hypothetical protein